MTFRRTILQEGSDLPLGADFNEIELHRDINVKIETQSNISYI